jgi:hypothetical protein
MGSSRPGWYPRSYQEALTGPLSMPYVIVSIVTPSTPNDYGLQGPEINVLSSTDMKEDAQAKRAGKRQLPHRDSSIPHFRSG